jgi:hypothetical protein
MNSGACLPRIYFSDGANCLSFTMNLMCVFFCFQIVIFVENFTCQKIVFRKKNVHRHVRAKCQPENGWQQREKMLFVFTFKRTFFSSPCHFRLVGDQCDQKRLGKTTKN